MISWVVNLMLPSGFLWAGFVSGGVLCTWLFVMVGYKKRRNLLKNGMWQLLLISAAGLLWDVFTGWHGWAVDFVLPLASLVILAAMTVVARVCRLEENEYLFYLVQIGAFGCIPGILLAAGGSPDPVSVFTLYRNQHSVAGRNRSFSWKIVRSGD